MHGGVLYNVLQMYASMYLVHSDIFCFVWFVRAVTHIWMCEVNFMFMHQCFSASTALNHHDTKQEDMHMHRKKITTNHILGYYSNVDVIRVDLGSNAAVSTSRSRGNHG